MLLTLMVLRFTRLVELLVCVVLVSQRNLSSSQLVCDVIDYIIANTMAVILSSRWKAICS